MFPLSAHTALLSLSLLSAVSSVRILGIFPIPFHSHQAVFRALVEELSRRGHELVVLTPLPRAQPLHNVTEIDVHDISFKLWDEGFKRMTKSSFAIDPAEFGVKIMPTIINIVDHQFSSPEMQAIINDKSQHFDVILIEATVEHGFIFSQIFKAPVIQVSSFFGFDFQFATFGAPIHPFIFPESMMQKFRNLSLLDKLSIMYSKIKMISMISDEIYSPLLKKYLGDDAPSMSELRKSSKMLFLNVHHIWDNNRPVPPSVLYMGALHLQKPKPIPKDLQTYFDSSKKGIIYMSLGSKVLFSDLPAHTMNAFLEVFASLPHDVLIKWNGGELANKPDNVRLEKWLPQNDILNHPKLKAFIMQGGLQSTDEAIAAQVPLIVLPVMGDQWYNADKIVQHEIGIQLDINNLNKNDLREAIAAVTENKRYRDNIGRLSRVMAAQRAGGLQRAAEWTEHVAAAGVGAADALHLRSPLADVTLVDYFMLDVLGVILAFVVLSLVLVICFIIFIVKRVKRLFTSNIKYKSS